MSLSPLPAAPAAGGATGPPVIRRVRDQADLFDASEIRIMEDRLRVLARETGFEVRVESRLFEGFGDFQRTAEERFEQEVGELGHYRLALVLIGVDRQEGRGMVGTNLGAGLYQVMSREEAADLFLSEGESFAPGRVRVGVERLAARLEEWHTMTRAMNEKLFDERRRPWYHRVGVRLYPLLALALLGVGAMWWLWRSRFCPECGARVRTRVRLGGPGGTAVRTAKCFECGYVRKRRYQPTSLVVPFLRGRGPGGSEE